MRVISLGWGVQSFALAAMSALGELPPVDAAIHADTMHERRETYKFAEKWAPWLEERGVKVVTVSAPAKITDIARWSGLPLYTLGPKGQGQLYRTCTDRWKIRPIRRWLRENMNGKQAEMWIGITLDEWIRMKDSPVQYIRNVYPFMDLDPPWPRGKVMRWLGENGLETPIKSSCSFCPYHDLATWRGLKVSNSEDWRDAVRADLLFREYRAEAGYQCFLHPSRIPLENVDLRNEQDHGQLELWGEECTGMCFL